MSTACLIFVSSLQTWYSDSFGNQLTSLTQCDVSVSSWDMIRVWRSPAFLNISVCCHIHCSIYLMLTIVTSWQEFLCLPCREMCCHAWHLALGLICFCKCFWWRFIGFCWLLFVSDPAGGIFRHSFLWPLYVNCILRNINDRYDYKHRANILFRSSLFLLSASSLWSWSHPKVSSSSPIYRITFPTLEIWFLLYFATT